MDRRDFLKLAAGAGAVALWGADGVLGESPASQPGKGGPGGARPNIVFIFSDDQRWDMLGPAGNKVIQTPNLDRMAREGVCFRQCTCVVSLCLPHRAAMLTGLAPHQNGLFGKNKNPTKDFTQPGSTLPGLLGQAGYHTVFAGKWHNYKYRPWTVGFADVRTWLNAGQTVYLDPTKLCRGNSTDPVAVKGYTNEIFADDAAEFIRSGAARDKPFFLWLSLTAPHGPGGPNPPRFVKMYEGKSDAELAPPGLPKDAKAQKAGDWAEYYQACTSVDDCVGRVLKALDERGLADSTLVVFLSDNGYMMGSRGLGGKIVPYEESIRVPLVVRWPGVNGFTGVSDAQVGSLDVCATFLAAAGVAQPKDWTGRNLAPAMKDKAPPGFEASFAELSDDRIEDPRLAQFRTVRTATHKFIRWEAADRPDELYDLLSDPHETKNLIAEAAHAKVRADLEKRLTGWMDRTGDFARKWAKKSG